MKVHKWNLKMRIEYTGDWFYPTESYKDTRCGVKVYGGVTSFWKKVTCKNCLRKGGIYGSSKTLKGINN